MWDPPRSGLEPVSPALAGRPSTTAPPGKPFPVFFWWMRETSLLWISQEVSTFQTYQKPASHSVHIAGQPMGVNTWKKTLLRVSSLFSKPQKNQLQKCFLLAPHLLTFADKYAILKYVSLECAQNGRFSWPISLKWCVYVCVWSWGEWEKVHIPAGQRNRLCYSYKHIILIKNQKGLFKIFFFPLRWSKKLEA